MTPSLKYGLIVGFAALLILIPVSAAMGICGPVVTLAAGAIAGFLAAYFGGAATRQSGAQAGALAGAVAGAVALVGQLAGGVLILVVIQATGPQLITGQAPGPAAPILEHAIYYGTGLAVGLCFGSLGLILAALAGALTGAFGVRASSPAPRLGAADGNAL